MRRKVHEQGPSNHHHQSASPTNGNENYPKKGRNIKDRFLAWIFNRNKVVVSLSIIMVLCLYQTIISKTYTNGANIRGTEKITESSNDDFNTTSSQSRDRSISTYEFDPPTNGTNTKSTEKITESSNSNFNTMLSSLHDHLTSTYEFDPPTNGTNTKSTEMMTGSSNSNSNTTSSPLLDRPISTYEVDSPIPHILWFTHKENILKTKEPEHFYKNVKNTIKLYSEAFDDITNNTSHPSSKTQVNFMDDNDCLTHISLLVSEMKNDYPKMANLGNHFIAEKDGSFKSDICRLAAIYLYGGYYFDVDMKVVKPFIAETFQRVSADNRNSSELIRGPPKLKALHDNWETNELIREINEKAKAEYKNDDPIEVSDAHNITFLTIFNERRDKFFQSFLACIPRHPVIKTNLLILIDYYEKGKKLAWKLPHNKVAVLEKDSLVGPETLYLAYFHETGVDPKVIGIGDPLKPTGDIIVEDVIFPEPKTKDANDYIILLNKEIRQKKDYLMSLLMASSNNSQKHIIDTSFVLQETLLLDGVLPDLPRQSKKEHKCNFIVHSQPRVQPLDLQERDVYFYSRVVNSGHNCPDETSPDSVSSWNSKPCGFGHVGNGQCPTMKECCSKYGWCGYGEEHCGINSAKVEETQPLTTSNAMREQGHSFRMGGPCGSGKIGNGQCLIKEECCSEYGWCGRGRDYCGRFPHFN